MNFTKVIPGTLLTFCLVIASSGIWAGETPTSLKGAEVIDAAKAKSLFDSGAKMIDTRVANEFAEAHIKGAIKESKSLCTVSSKSESTYDLTGAPIPTCALPVDNLSGT